MQEYKILDKYADIVTLYFDKYGYLWIGTLGEGVVRFNPTTGKTRKITNATDTEGSSVLSINGKDNTVWVAGFNSVSKFIISENGNSDEATIEKVPVFKGSELLNDYVYAVFIDSKGLVWFGTDGNGVYCFDGAKLKNFPVKDNAVHGFTEDKKGNIWFSTADGGLQCIGTDNKMRYFQTKDGLSDPTPTSVLCVNNGNIIIVHSNGFDVLDPVTKDIIYHSTEENLDNIKCDFDSIVLGPDGTVWMGTEMGILHYRPRSDMKIQPSKGGFASGSCFPQKAHLRATINSMPMKTTFDSLRAVGD